MTLLCPYANSLIAHQAYSLSSMLNASMNSSTIRPLSCLVRFSENYYQGKESANNNFTLLIFSCYPFTDAFVALPFLHWVVLNETDLEATGSVDVYSTLIVLGVLPCLRTAAPLPIQGCQPYPRRRAISGDRSDVNIRFLVVEWLYFCKNQI